MTSDRNHISTEIYQLPGLLVDAEVPLGDESSVVVLDQRLDLSVTLGVRSWPTALLCNGPQILFALEDSRVTTDLTFRAISALLTAVDISVGGIKTLHIKNIQNI